jgi:bla regulator protein blaR1
MTSLPLQVLQMLLSTTIICSSALLLVFAIRFPLRRWGGAGVTYAAWLIVPLALLTHLLSSALPLPTTDLMPTKLSLPALVQATNLGVPRGAQAPLQLLLLIWASGCVAFACVLVRQQSRFRRALGPLTPYPHKIANRPLHLATRSNVGPLLCGLLQPRIVLPVDFETRYSNAEQRLIIAHELVHWKRGDLFANAFAALLQTLFWFNPLVHIARTRMRFDQELACDAAVLSGAAANADRRANYASAILKSALPQQSAAITCHWQSRHPLTERIMQLSKTPQNRILRRTTQVSLAMFAIAACYGTSGSAAPTAGAGQYKIDITYVAKTTDANGNTNTRRSTFAVIQDAGKQASFKPGNDPTQTCEFAITVTPMKENQVLLDLPIKCADYAAHPKLVTEIGQSASFQTTQGTVPSAQTVHDVTLLVTRRGS